MVVTRNSGVSENYIASKKILRDIKSCKSLRPRVSNPNYREESPEEGSYSFFHKIIKVGVSNKKSVSHKLKFQSSNRDKTFKGIHRFQLRTSESNNNNSNNNNNNSGNQKSNQNENDNKDKSIADFTSNKMSMKSDDNAQMAVGAQALLGDSGPNNAATDGPTGGDASKLDAGSNNNNGNERKKYLFTSNMNTRSFKRRISASFSRLPEMDNSQKCYESPRRYPSRLRRQPTDVYTVNCSFKNDRKSNWQESMSPSIRSKHRKLELHSKQSDTDDSDGLLEDEIRFEKRKQQSIQRARSELNPINMSTSDLKMDLFNDRSIARGSLADIEPMAIDQSITFDMVGGNRKYIQALKESVILPLVYPEVFKKLSINPPRGLLFYGPPGSGKTLLARALVNECNRNSNCKLAFFMRKGADCLSKWVGESERQLRLLFDQAYRMRPSIIFFDEIDGLAPVRSVRQDQIHSSIVSTLLSLIDGLDDRGEIIVIGATNRIDSIDPALRRPGRFDREFMFTLPEEKERMDIIKIHTRDWRPPLSGEMVTKIASVTKGFSGADIKALVVEAGLCALRRRYPQIYHNHNKLQLNLNEIFIKEEDFKVAIKMIRPSNERSGFPLHSPIPKRIGLLLDHDYCVFKEKVANFFPEQVFSLENSAIESDNNDLLAHHSESSPTAEYSPFFKPRLLVTGFGIEQLISGLFHEIYHVNVFSFDSLCLGVNNGFSPEEKLYNIFREADKTPKSIVYLPHIDITFHSLSLSGQNLLLQMIRSHNSNTELSVRTILILTTLSNSATGTWNDVEFDNVQSTNIWSELGKGFQSSVVKIAPPSFEQRLVYFGELIHLATRPIDSGIQSKHNIDPRDEVLQEVQMAPRTLNKEELEKLEIEEDNVLRKFRMLLRKILASLAKERKFQVFLNPVDITEVPDYYSIIANPIDLSTMRQKVDLYNYNTFDEFKNDLHLITANALLYNPPTNSYLKDIRRHAYEFNDFAESISEDNWSPQFEKIINDIHQSRLQRKYYDKIKNATTLQTDDVREFLIDLNGSKLDIANGPLFRTQLQLYAKFYKSNKEGVRNANERRPHSDNEVVIKKLINERKCKSSKSVSDGDCADCDEESIKTTVQTFKRFQQAALKVKKDTNIVNEALDIDQEIVDSHPPPQRPVSHPELIKINLPGMNEVIRTAARRTDCSTILQLEELYFLLSKEIFKFSTHTDRSALSKNLGQILKEYFH